MEEQPIPVSTPLATKERFSEMTGLGEDVIRGMIERGHLPSVKVGRYRLVNVALLNQELIREVWEK